MNGKIKGITIEIGGDTTKLGNAIASAEKESRSLQTELRSVERLLKFDPSNTELLSQKQKILGEAVQSTKDKLEILKEAQEDIKRQFANGEIDEGQYRAFQREVAATEEQLKYLEKQAESFGSVFAQQCKVAGEKLQDVGGKIEDVGRSFGGLSATAAAVLTGSTYLASDFTDSMAKLNTIADTSVTSLDELTTQVLSLSDQTGISASVIANASYDAISAGQDTADAVGFVSNATGLARAGFADTADAIDILTTIMNAYGLEAAEVTQVSDMLVQTQNLGKTTVAQLSGSMGKVIPTAKSMSVELDQVTAGYTIMTAKGIATSEATTYMNAMFNELGKSGTTVSDVLKEKTGKSFSQLMEDGYTLGDALGILQDYADESGQSFNDLWGSMNAAKAGLTLLDDGVDGFNSRVEEMNACTGSTAEALEKLETPSYQAQVAINKLKNAGITLGQSVLEAVAPVLDKLCDLVDRLTTWFNGLSDSTKTTIVTILGIVAALSPVIIVIGKVVTGIGQIIAFAPTITSAITKIKTVVTGLFTLIAAHPVIAIITAIVAAVVYLWNTNEDFRDAVISIFNKIVEFLGNAVEAIKQFFTETIPEAIGKAVTFFQELPGKIMDAIKQVIRNIQDWATELYQTITTAVSETVDRAVTFFQELPEKIWNAILEAVQRAKAWGTEMAQTISEGAKKAIDSALKFFNELPEKIGYAIGFAIGKVAAWGVNLYHTITEAVQNAIDSAVTFFQELPEKIWNAIINTIEKVQAWGEEVKQNFIENVTAIIENTITFFQELPEKIWNAIVSTSEKIQAWGTEVRDTIVEHTTNLINQTVTFFKELPGKIASAISSTAQRVKEWGAGVYKAAVETVKNTIENVTNFFKELPGKIVGAIQPAIARVVEWGTNMKNTAGNKMKEVVSIVVDTIKAIPGKMKSIGTDIVRGIWEGINGAVGWLKDKISGFASSVIKGFKDAFVIKSPSRRAKTEVGMDISRGVGAGIEEAADVPIKAAEDLSDQLIEDVAGKKIETQIAARAAENRIAYQKEVLDSYKLPENAEINMIMNGKVIARVVAPFLDVINGGNMILAERGLA